MSNSREDRYYASLGKTGKSPPLGDQAPGFFQTGQASTYPNQYTQPRSMPTRYDYNHALYNQWPGNNQSSAHMNYAYYDTTDNRYASNYYSAYPSSRTSPAPEHSDSRKLPPLTTTSGLGRDDRWSSNTASYSVGPAENPSYSGIRSPTASYPPSFAAYPTPNSTNNYGNPVPMTDAHTQSHIHAASHASMMLPESHRPVTPSYAPSGLQIPPSYTPPPVSPTTGTANEPLIKKKRKPFPSTEERQALAKLLDMSARSVQIWFQNKRQSMRQTQTRQSSSSGTTLHQSFGVSNPNEYDASGYESTGIHVPSSTYVSRTSQESHTSSVLSPTVSHRRPRSQDSVSNDTAGTKPQQWSPSTKALLYILFFIPHY
ncbi:homeobox protein [Lentinula edodes]|uniref:Homeobox protein n=1 Tax=Lentinula edodes TaxID=5353 RepID=A0A1Q3EAY3_LENED|nr:homeobox protein [Lentinula edodes]